ncbi:bifunctional DNA-formamidopyrimidine glycosylase/DNA-(apurinic or apyrimidinic site) lyase [Patescibacteria group bacterium]|nr:bifunctional DNA-formamidopyrimidine glycosylase/DNA-(apurinic or apyrimidinic site) lyase [Patescibacteria group bacterium]
MPELPEVQTVVSDLEKKVVEKTIGDFGSEWRKAVRPSFVEFRKGVIGKKIVGSRRIGKHIVLSLSSGDSIVIHLKMTGHLLFKNKEIRSWSTKLFEERVNGYVRHWFVFKDGCRLEFSDMRKFAWVALVKSDKVCDMKEIVCLGIDALDSKLTFKVFNDLLNKKPKSKIGILLLDQHWVAGIGNIYRSEILFDAGVRPERLVGDLGLGERKKIYSAMRMILRKAVKLRGTSDMDYRDTDGKKGSFQNFLKVYRRTGEKCVGCEGKVKTFKMGQRSVFYCDKCQK